MVAFVISLLWGITIFLLFYFSFPKREAVILVEEKKEIFSLGKRIFRDLSFNRWLLRNRWLRQRLLTSLEKLATNAGMKLGELLLLKEMSAFFILLLALLLGIQSWILLFGLVLVGGFLPDIFLVMKHNQEMASISREMPNFLDTLLISIEGGVDIFHAIEKILAKKKRETPLSREFGLVLQQIKLGIGHRKALEDLAQRTRVPEIGTFTSLVVQTDELGARIDATLHDYIDDLRDRRIQKAEMLAQQVPTKMLIPMVLFIFPAVFVIILGPVILQFIVNPPF